MQLILLHSKYLILKVSMKVTVKILQSWVTGEKHCQRIISGFDKIRMSRHGMKLSGNKQKRSKVLSQRMKEKYGIPCDIKIQTAKIQMVLRRSFLNYRG